MSGTESALHTTSAEPSTVLAPRVYQDLRSFRLRDGFRGRSAFVVQLWWLVQGTLFGLSPQFMYGWRRWLLRLFGARVGERVLIRPTARVTYPWKLRIGEGSWIGDFAELYSLGPIEIGRDAVVSQYAYVCGATHDYRSPAFDMVEKPIRIEDQAWVAAGAFIQPGVVVGRGAVVAARAVLTADAEAGGIYAGCPATRIGTR